MSSEFLQLSKRFSREVGVDGIGPASVQNQTGMFLKLVDWIADADEAICSRWLDWGFLHKEFKQDTIVDTEDVSAPADFGNWDTDSFVLDYSTANFKVLNKLDYFVWRDQFRNGAVSSTTPHFVIIKPNKDLILWPPPKAVQSLTADYYATATRMTENDSVSLIPKKFDRLVIAQAKVYYAEHENAPEVMTAASNEYHELINNLESLYLYQQEPRTQSRNTDMVVTPE